MGRSTARPARSPRLSPQALKEHGLDVETLAAARVDDLEPYAGVVVGGAIYMGRWHPDAVELLERHRHALATRPGAGFGMGARRTDRRRLRLREKPQRRRGITAASFSRAPDEQRPADTQAGST